MPRHPLTLSQFTQLAALAALEDGTADAALLRLPVDDQAISTIPLYAEQPVVVAPKGHALEAVDTVTLPELREFGVLEGEWAATVELAAANVGVAVMPQSVARAYSRKDVTARPVTDAPETRVALAWLTARTTPEMDELIGIVRGRTANSSRGRQPEKVVKTKPTKPTKASRPSRPTRGKR
jgi:DNA-binding transcriptional LysR family regulator